MVNEADLIRHLRALTGLETGVLEKILNEVKSWYAEDLDAWILRRHKELQSQKLRNLEIYRTIREEAERHAHPSGTAFRKTDPQGHLRVGEVRAWPSPAWLHGTAPVQRHPLVLRPVVGSSGRPGKGRGMCGIVAISGVRKVPAAS